MAKSLTVLMPTHNYPRFDGDFSGVFLRLLARKLLAHDIKPVILTPHDAGIPESEDQDGVIVERFRYAPNEKDQNIAYRGDMQKRAFGSPAGAIKFRRFLTRFERRALELIDEHEVDLIAGHWLVPAGIVMKRLKRRTPLPMVLSSHGSDIRLMGKFGGLPFKYFGGFCRRLERWTVVSTFLKQAAERLDPQLERVLEVLPLPHDDSLFYRDDNIERDPNLVLAVTRFTKQKRVSQLIEAFGRVVATHPDARLEIYGTGPDEEVIRQLIARRELGDTVRIHAPVGQAELRTIYNRAVIVVLNSVKEGFGLVLSEAMMCGAAVVGADSGGIPDIIEHEKRGLLVPADDPEALANAIGRLLTDHELRMQLADAGHRFAVATYAAGPLAARYADILRSAAG